MGIVYHDLHSGQEVVKRDGGDDGAEYCAVEDRNRAARESLPQHQSCGSFILEPPRSSWLAFIAKSADPVKWAAAQARLRKEVA